MKTLKKMTLLFLLFFPFLTGCHKDTIQPNKAATEYFPNKVGDYWEYDVHDSTAGYTEVEDYAVKVTIVGITKLIDGNDATVWQYSYPSGNDTNYVRIVGDTVKVYNASRIETVRGLEFPLRIYFIPFSNEQRWEGKLLMVDSFHVYATPSVRTPAGVFTSCFNIYHYYLGPNMENMDNYWFKPNIGMIKINLNQYDFSPKTFRTWNLKKYYLH